MTSKRQNLNSCKTKASKRAVAEKLIAKFEPFTNPVFKPCGFGSDYRRDELIADDIPTGLIVSYYNWSRWKLLISLHEHLCL